jgi:hypothetical protein
MIHSSEIYNDQAVKENEKKYMDLKTIPDFSNPKILTKDYHSLESQAKYIKN